MLPALLCYQRRAHLPATSVPWFLTSSSRKPSILAPDMKPQHMRPPTLVPQARSSDSDHLPGLVLPQEPLPFSMETRESLPPPQPGLLPGSFTRSVFFLPSGAILTQLLGSQRVRSDRPEFKFLPSCSGSGSYDPGDRNQSKRETPQRCQPWQRGAWPRREGGQPRRPSDVASHSAVSDPL